MKNLIILILTLSLFSCTQDSSESNQPIIHHGGYGFWKVFRNTEGTKYGIISDKNVIVQNAVYDEIFVDDNGFGIATKGSKFFLLDKKGETVNEKGFQDLMPFCTINRAPVKVNGSWGAIDTLGEVIIEPLYDTISQFVHGVASVSERGKYWLIGTKGNRLTLKPYEDIWQFPFDQRVTVYRDSGKFGYLSVSGDPITEPQFEGISSFDLDSGKVMLNSRWGAVDSNGNYLVKPIAESPEQVWKYGEH